MNHLKDYECSVDSSQLETTSFHEQLQLTIRKNVKNTPHYMKFHLSRAGSLYETRIVYEISGYDAYPSFYKKFRVSQSSYSDSYSDKSMTKARFTSSCSTPQRARLFQWRIMSSFTRRHTRQPPVDGQACE